MGGDEIAMPVAVKKKSKKSKKDKASVDHGSVGVESKGHVEPDSELQEENGQKRKSRSNEDGNNAQHGKGNLEGGGNLQKKNKKKRRRDSTEDGDNTCHVEGNLEGERNLQKKNKKKRKRDSAESEQAQIEENKDVPADEAHAQGDCDQEPRKEKKNKRKNKDLEKEVGTGSEMHNGEECADKKTTKSRAKSRDAKGMEVLEENLEGENHNNVGKKENKMNCHESDTEMRGAVTGESGKEGSTQQNTEKAKSVENDPGKPKPKTKSKRVSFSGDVEVFPSSATSTKYQQTQKDQLVQGKRFTEEEDEIIKEAVLNYIKNHDLGEDGLEKVMNCKAYGLRCWREIGLCLPNRPFQAVYSRAHVLFESGNKGTWTPEETEMLLDSHKKHGKDWKLMAQELGKHRFHVKDKWRRIRYANLKKGRWDQEEYQRLYNLVNVDLQMKALSQEKKSKHGMLRDNIPWGAISEKLSTRSDTSCCEKWYSQLQSPMVSEGKWADVDDYLLIGALYDLDATCVDDVDWDNLLEHRSGEYCRKRWNQMVMHIGHYKSQPFTEQVDILAQRYSPALAEARKAWDSKSVVT